MTKAYWCKNWDHPNPQDVIDVWEGPEKEPGDLVIRSDRAKKVLATHLREHNPEFLDLLKAFGGAFGPVTVVMRENQALKGKLDEMRDRSHGYTKKAKE